MAYSFGPRAGPPTLAQGHGPQVVAGLVAFNAAVASLFAAERPRRIAVNVLEAYLCLSETGAVSALFAGGVSVRLGVNRFVPSYPCTSYRTADGWIGVTALTPAQWRGLCEMVGRPELAREPRFTTSVERLLAADEIDGLIAPHFLERPTDAWVRLGFEKRVPITPMPDLRQLPTTPHWAGRGTFGSFDQSGHVAPTLPFRIAAAGAPLPPIRGDGPAAPLKGLRVVDFTMGWAGPLCTRTLADLGAEVIKIESDAHPDWWRGWEKEAGDPPPHEVKFSFICVNRNKRGIVLDLSTHEGRAQAEALIARADVLVENFAAGVLENLGFGPAVRRRINPRLIAVSMPAFGAGGPLTGVRAYGSTVEQASGLPFANGAADWPPALQHVALGDPIAGLYTAAATLCALYDRRDGGAEIDVAQVEGLMQLAADALIAQQLIHAPLPRTGSRRPRAAPVCVVRADAEDSWLAVAVDGDAAWAGLCDALERTDWAADATLASPTGRAARADELEAAIAAWAGSRSRDEGAATLQAHGVPAAPVQAIDSLCYDPQLATTGFWFEMHRRYVGDHLIPQSPWTYDGARQPLRTPAPTLGEHTAEVLAELGAEVA
jgi:crotonobetainyl-CoA:carnitine CoA-transferase CaiB-like acyl-CoA transferase